MTLTTGLNAVTIVPPSSGSYIMSLPPTLGTNGQVFTTDGAGATYWSTVSGGGGSGTVTSVGASAPSFLSVTAPITTSGTLDFTYSGTALPITSGGTGLTTPGTIGQYLAADGSGGLAYVNPSAGTGSVLSVGASAPSFLTVTGSPITTTGVLAFTYSGTALPTANGGTGSTSASTGSGGVVLDTSPSLTTPNIGTATGTKLTLITASGGVAPIYEGFNTLGGSGSIVIGKNSTSGNSVNYTYAHIADNSPLNNLTIALGPCSFKMTNALTTGFTFVGTLNAATANFTGDIYTKGIRDSGTFSSSFTAGNDGSTNTFRFGRGNNPGNKVDKVFSYTSSNSPLNNLTTTLGPCSFKMTNDLTTGFTFVGNLNASNATIPTLNGATSVVGALSSTVSLSAPTATFTGDIYTTGIRDTGTFSSFFTAGNDGSTNTFKFGRGNNPGNKVDKVFSYTSSNSPLNNLTTTLGPCSFKITNDLTTGFTFVGNLNASNATIPTLNGNVTINDGATIPTINGATSVVGALSSTVSLSAPTANFTGDIYTTGIRDSGTFSYFLSNGSTNTFRFGRGNNPGNKVDKVFSYTSDNSPLNNLTTTLGPCSLKMTNDLTTGFTFVGDINSNANAALSYSLNLFNSNSTGLTLATIGTSNTAGNSAQIQFDSDGPDNANNAAIFAITGGGKANLILRNNFTATFNCPLYAPNLAGITEGTWIPSMAQCWTLAGGTTPVQEDWKNPTNFLGTGNWTRIGKQVTVYFKAKVSFTGF